MTREEALCAFTVGVKQFIVAINKMDHKDVNYSQERFENIAQEVTVWPGGCLWF
jgi:elongation factor 1-alpha